MCHDCLQFKDIFAGGEEMCNTVWGSSFKYEPNETVGYTWWYFDQDESPNDAATLARGLSVPDTCDVTYFHKSAPSPEGDDIPRETRRRIRFGAVAAPQIRHEG